MPLAGDWILSVSSPEGWGTPPLVVTHAEMALTHARAAAELSESPHLGLAIQGLESAVSHGGMGHAEIATASAQEALNPLGFSVRAWFHMTAAHDFQPTGTITRANVCIYRSRSAALVLLEADLLRFLCSPALQLYV